MRYARHRWTEGGHPFGGMPAVSGSFLALIGTGDSCLHVRSLRRHPGLLPLGHRPISSCRRWRGPSRVGLLLAVALAALASSRCCQAEEGAPLAPPQVGGVGAAEPQRWYWDPFRDFAVDLARDTGQVLTAPARWDSHDWLLAGLAGGTIVGAAVCLDEPIHRFNNEHSSRFADHLAKRAEPFGTIYSFAVLGAFEVAGLALDDRARQRRISRWPGGDRDRLWPDHPDAQVRGRA